MNPAIRRIIFSRVNGAAAVSLALVLLAALPVCAQSTSSQVVPGELLVHLAPGQTAESVAAQYQTSIITHACGGSIVMLQTPAGTTDAAFQTQLAASPLVTDVEPNLVTSVTEFTGSQFHFAFDKGPDPGAYVNQQAYEMVNAPSSKSGDGTGVTVAVLDTGVNMTHPALLGHVVSGYDTMSPSRLPLDLPDGITNEAAGHGTMIAGIIAMVAPGAGIMPVRVLSADGFGTLFDVMAGIDWAAKHGANVINMSFGSPVDSPMLDNEIQGYEQQGVTFVAAAGNDGAEISNYPASSPGVVSVASIETNMVKSSYSDYGREVDLVAPGTGIRSTYYDGGYATWSGTSFATPFVSAGIADVIAVSQDNKRSDAILALYDQAQDVERFNPQYEGMLGNGLPDVADTVAEMGSDDINHKRFSKHID